MFTNFIRRVSSSWRYLITRPPFHPFERDRYDPDDLLQQLSGQQPKLVNGYRELTFQAKPGEFYAVLPDANERFSPDALDLLGDILRDLREMDNLVQDSCEKEHSRSKLAARNFTLAIGGIDLTRPSVFITYHGTGVNTVWDARFTRDTDGSWRPLNF